MMEYRIGEITGELPHKFVVVRGVGSLVFYAGPQFNAAGRQLAHAEIAELYGLKERDVVGRGCCALAGETLKVGAMPDTMPVSDLTLFEETLLAAYRKLAPAVKRVDIGMFCESPRAARGGQLSRVTGAWTLADL